MNTAISFKLLEIARHFIKDEKKATEFIHLIEETVEDRFTQETTILATKVDLASLEVKIETKMSSLETKMSSLETKISNRIYFVGLIQFLAIVGSVLAIVSFMIK